MRAVREEGADWLILQPPPRPAMPAGRLEGTRWTALPRGHPACRDSERRHRQHSLGERRIGGTSARPPRPRCRQGGNTQCEGGGILAETRQPLPGHHGRLESRLSGPDSSWRARSVSGAELRARTERPAPGRRRGRLARGGPNSRKHPAADAVHPRKARYRGAYVSRKTDLLRAYPVRSRCQPQTGSAIAVEARHGVQENAGGAPWRDGVKRAGEHEETIRVIWSSGGQGCPCSYAAQQDAWQDSCKALPCELRIADCTFPARN